MKNHLSLLKKTLGVGGAGIGAAIGALAGPGSTMVGAGAGAAVGEACKYVLDDIANRYLSPREELRVVTVATVAIGTISERLLWGEHRRGDDFFSRDSVQPSPAEELFEGVLLSAKGEHEELKLPYLANLYSNLVFAPDVSRSEANHLLTIADGLTYEQFRLLSLIDQSRKFALRSDEWRDHKLIPVESRSLAQQMLYLYQRQLLITYDEDGEIGGEIYNVDQVAPARANLSHIGRRLSNLLGLRQIPEQELKDLSKQL